MVEARTLVQKLTTLERLACHYHMYRTLVPRGEGRVAARASSHCHCFGCRLAPSSRQFPPRHLADGASLAADLGATSAAQQLQQSCCRASLTRGVRRTSRGLQRSCICSSESYCKQESNQAARLQGTKTQAPERSVQHTKRKIARK
jgi:hypothetical protein